MTHDTLIWMVVLSAAYLAGGYLVAFLALAVNALKGTGGRASQSDDLSSLAVSRFTIPVSIVVPSFDEERTIVASVESLLQFNYPELEVIVVSDGSGGTLERLKDAFELEPREVFYRKKLPTQGVRRIYRSARDARLVVIEKDRVGRADAVNCGVNLARFRYISVVAGDTIYERDALLKAMPEAIRDPAGVLGITSHVDVHLEPGSSPFKAGSRLLSGFQHVERLRWLMTNKAIWSRLGFRLGQGRAFAIWRHDAILDVGGFATDMSGEEIDITFKIQARYANEDQPGRVVSLPAFVGQTEAAGGIGRLIAEYARAQRVVWESVWRYRHMLANRRFGLVGRVGFPYVVLAQILNPVLQLAAFTILTAAWLTHVVSGAVFFPFLATLMLASGILTSLALLSEAPNRQAHSFSSLCRLIVLGPLEPVCYRPLILLASLIGAARFVLGERRSSERQRETPARAA